MDVSINTYSVLKQSCDKIYYMGVGDFWYEPPNRPIWKKILYKVYFVLAFFIIYSVVFLEFLEAIFYTFPSDQHRDAVTYAIAQTNVFVKLTLFIRAKDKVKSLLHDMVNACKGYEDYDLLKIQARKVKTAIVLQFGAVYFSLTMYCLEGLRRMYFDGDFFHI